jgi:hypothetical protein
MVASVFDPKKFIDREFEQEIFEELILLKAQARILSIRDLGGMGKSQLLEKFQYRCRTIKPRIPVAFVHLGELPEQTPLLLARALVTQLSNFSIRFPAFHHMESARLSADFSSIRSSVYLQGANFTAAKEVKISGTELNVERVSTINVGHAIQLTSEQELLARNASVQAFLDDLSATPLDRPVVLMLDAYEKCDPVLRAWIMQVLLDKYFFDLQDRPARLVLVVAGQEVPLFDQYWGPLDCELVTRSVSQLSRWKRQHVEECLRIHGFDDFTPTQLDTFMNLIDMGIPPSQVVQAIQTSARARQRTS